MIDVEKVLGRSVAEIDNVIADFDKHIHTFEVPKRKGGTRTIVAPDDELKRLQQRINYKILIYYHPENVSHGFVRKRSIITNAIVHVGARSVGKMDISSFFDTISPSHIRNGLCGNRNICRYCSRYPEMEAGRCSPSIYKNKDGDFDHKCEELKSIFLPDYCKKTGYVSLFQRVIGLTSYKGSACQGFPTSPYLANIVMAGFDRMIRAVANEFDCAYTRYADDMTFSSKTMDKDELRATFEDVVERKLFGFGFKAKKEKTKFKNSGRFSVCGIVCNVKPNIARENIMRFRAMVHNATVKRPLETTQKWFNHLKGWASFLCSVNPGVGRKYMDKLVAFEKDGPIPRPNTTPHIESDNYFKVRAGV